MLIVHIVIGITVAYAIIAAGVFLYHSIDQYENFITSIYRGLFWGPRFVRELFRLAVKDFKGN